MKKIIITIQDVDHGEFISSQVVEEFSIKLDENYLISLVRKAEKDLEKLILQRELENSENEFRKRKSAI